MFVGYACGCAYVQNGLDPMIKYRQCKKDCPALDWLFKVLERMKKPEPLLKLDPEDSIIPFKLSREQWEDLKHDKNFIREGSHFPDITVEGLESQKLFVEAFQKELLSKPSITFIHSHIGLHKCEDCSS